MSALGTHLLLVFPSCIVVVFFRVGLVLNVTVMVIVVIDAGVVVVNCVAVVLWCLV